MSSPESTYYINTGERIGYLARNIGVVIAAIGLFVPSLIGPGLVLAVSGEGMRRVSKK